MSNITFAPSSRFESNNRTSKTQHIYIKKSMLYSYKKIVEYIRPQRGLGDKHVLAGVVCILDASRCKPSGPCFSRKVRDNTSMSDRMRQRECRAHKLARSSNPMQQICTMKGLFQNPCQKGAVLRKRLDVHTPNLAFSGHNVDG